MLWNTDCCPDGSTGTGAFSCQSGTMKRLAGGLPDELLQLQLGMLIRRADNRRQSAYPARDTDLEPFTGRYRLP
ncbi:MAG: hypothetical protein ACLSFT_11550 [Ruminococcus callidus]